MRVKLIECDLDGLVVAMPSMDNAESLITWIGSVVRNNNGRRLTESLVSAICDSTLCNKDEEYDILLDLKRGLVVNRDDSCEKRCTIEEFLSLDKDLFWAETTSKIVSKRANLAAVEESVDLVIRSGAFTKGDGFSLEVLAFLDSHFAADDAGSKALKNKMVESGML
ncbi:hypothetical protein [Photobacterium damselae]|uniref:hypothetical protein n=1 Tax=Photobacterium damselae TaxID=38293 RepID=UPI00406808E3